GWGDAIAANAIFYGVALVVFTAASLIRGKWLFAKYWRWLDEDRPPTAEERRVVLRQPLAIALFPLRYWTTAAVVSVIVRVAVGAPANQIVVGAVAVLEGGLVAAALGFFLGERALRPVFAEALAGTAPETPAALGVGPRLVL